MAKTDVLIDAGPLAAAFYQRDQHYEWARRQVSHISPPVYTCEAVLSEAFHLLERVPQGAQKLLDFLERGFVEVAFAYADHAGPVRELMRTYADQPMSFADAGLVRMAEVRRAAQVFTTDADFRVYRTAGGEALDVLAPGGR